MRGLRSLLNYMACATFVAGAVFSLAACGDDSPSSASNDLPQTTEKCGEEGSYKTVKSDKVGGQMSITAVQKEHGNRLNIVIL